jgi:tRNA G10  N-methylase Trm11
MAWVACPRPGEVIWDPFCGSGSELIECALLEPTVRLFGTDRDGDALAAAAENFAAANLTVEAGGLVQADALRSRPGGADAAKTPSLIITNPPMGRRVGSGYGVHELLQRFVVHAARLLPPGGRLVWVTPAAKASAAAGREAGLQVIDHGPIDLAGLRVHLQVMAREL